MTTVLHEVRHNVQHHYVERYNKQQKTNFNSEPSSEVALFKAEFEEPVSDSDYEAYYNQSIERDSREYAESTASWYSRLIDEYCKANNK